MSKREKNRIWLVVAIGCALVGVFGNRQAIAADGSHEPSVSCQTTGSRKCVIFGSSDLTGKIYPLGNQLTSRATILGVINASVLDTSTPVRLSEVKENTRCPNNPSPVPMNAGGSELIVSEDDNQYMYLISNGSVLKRKVAVASRKVGKNNTSVVWLLATTVKGDKDPYDYFVEFNANSPSMKSYRVEAFPHLDSSHDPVVHACYCERPDVLQPDDPQSAEVRSCEIRRPHIRPEPTTSGGNEPGH